jgi:hypothetical protein
MLYPTKNINYDDETHTYSVENGYIINSVTQIIKLAGISPDFSGISNYYADRGSRLHDEVEFFNMTNMRNKVDEDILGMMENYLFFRKEVEDRYEIICNEELGYYEEGNIKFAGRADCIAIYEGEEVVIDYKTSSQLRRYHKLQLGGYMAMFGLNAGYLLQLREDFYKFVRVESTYKKAFLDICNVLFNTDLEIEEKQVKCKEIFKPVR